MCYKEIKSVQTVLPFILLFLFFWGCKGQNELPETAPVSIRKKIISPATPVNTVPYDTWEHKTMPDSKETADLLIAAAEKKTDAEYNPEKKFDPFVPFLKKINDPPPVNPNNPGDKPDIVPVHECFSTPLVEMGLSQLKLVGIIRSRTGNRGLVQDASNQGYIVTRGTCIGLNFGKVAEILKEKIIIEEKFKDHEYVDGYWKSKIITRKREMALLKPEGI